MTVEPRIFLVKVFNISVASFQLVRPCSAVALWSLRRDETNSPRQKYKRRNSPNRVSRLARVSHGSTARSRGQSRSMTAPARQESTFRSDTPKSNRHDLLELRRNPRNSRQVGALLRAVELFLSSEAERHRLCIGGPRGDAEWRRPDRVEVDIGVQRLYIVSQSRFGDSKPTHDASGRFVEFGDFSGWLQLFEEVNERESGHHPFARICFDLLQAPLIGQLCIECIEATVHVGRPSLDLSAVVGQAQPTSTSRHREHRHDQYCNQRSHRATVIVRRAKMARMDDISEAALVKLMRVTLRPGHREKYLQSQAVWNRESRLAPGYLGEFIGDGEQDVIHLITFWRSRADYDSWMTGDHDRVATLAGAEAHYEALEVRIVDRVGQVESRHRNGWSAGSLDS